MPREKTSLRDILPLLEMFGPNAQANMELAAAQAAQLRSAVERATKRDPLELQGLEADIALKKEDARAKPILTQNAIDQSQFDREKGKAELDFTRQKLPIELKGIEAQTDMSRAQADRARQLVAPEVARMVAETAGITQANDFNLQTAGPKLQLLLEQAAGAGLDNHQRREMNPLAVEGARITNRTNAQQAARAESRAPLEEDILRSQGRVAQSAATFADASNAANVAESVGRTAANQAQTDRVNKLAPAEYDRMLAETTGFNQQNEFNLQTAGPKLQLLLEQAATAGINTDLARLLSPLQVTGARTANKLAQSQAEIADSNARFSDDLNTSKIDEMETRRKYVESETQGNRATQGFKEAQSLAAIRGLMQGSDGQMIPGSDAYLAEFQKGLEVLGPAAVAGEAQLRTLLPGMLDAMAKAGKPISPQMLLTAQRLGIPVPQVKGADPLGFSLWDLTDPTELMGKNISRAARDIRQGTVFSQEKEQIKKDLEPLNQLLQYFQGTTSQSTSK